MLIPFNNKSKFNNKYNMKKFKNLLLTLSIFFLCNPNIANAKLLSFQSEYDISLAEIDSPRVPGKTYVDKASGYLLIDWINNCEQSWVTTQRMMTKFVNSHGVGTVSEINYSLNEMSDGNKMEFVLEVKEDAEVVERHYGKAERKESLNIKFEQTDKEYNFSAELSSNKIKDNVKTDIIVTKIEKIKIIVFFLNFEEKKNRNEINKRTNRKIKALII